MAGADERLAFEEAIEDLRRSNGTGYAHLLASMKAMLDDEQRLFMGAPSDTLRLCQGRVQIMNSLVTRMQDAASKLDAASARQSPGKHRTQP